MKKTLLILLVAATNLISCNSSYDLAKTDEATARTRAQKIYQAQRDESFAVPGAYFVHFHNLEKKDDKTFQGKTNYTKDTVQEFNWDIEKIACRVYDKFTNSDGPCSEEESIYFFDEKENKICCAINKNGYKYYYYDQDPEHSGRENAKRYLIETYRDSTRGKSIKMSYILSGFSEAIKWINQLIEKTKGKNDEYAEVYYGTNDERSVQMRNKAKIKATYEKQDTKFDYNGYEITQNNDIFENNLLAEHHTLLLIDAKTDNNLFSVHTHLSNDTTVDQNNSRLTLPNLKDYTKQD